MAVVVATFLTLTFQQKAKWKRPVSEVKGLYKLQESSVAEDGYSEEAATPTEQENEDDAPSPL